MHFERKIYEFPLPPRIFIFRLATVFSLYKYTEATGDYVYPDKSTS